MSTHSIRCNRYTAQDEYKCEEYLFEPREMPKRIDSETRKYCGGCLSECRGIGDLNEDIRAT